MQQLCQAGQPRPSSHTSTNMNTPAITMHELLSKYIHEFTTITHSITRLLITLAQAPAILHNQTISSFTAKLNCSIFNTLQHPQYRAMLENSQGEVSGNANVTVNTLRRFACRIVQALLAFKQKVEVSACLGLAMHFVGKLERLISELQEGNSLGKFVEGVWECLKLFQETVKINYQNRGAHVINKKANGANGKYSTQRSNIKREEDNQTTQTNPKLTSLISTSTTRAPHLNPKSFQVQPEYQRKMRKIIHGINSRFKTMDCMDLDYGYFRSSFFLAKNDGSNGGEFHEQYLGRNQTMQAQMAQYSSDYKEYVKKKDKRRTQRNFQLMSTKLNLNKTYSKDTKPSNQDISASIYIDRRGSMKLGSWLPQNTHTNLKQKILNPINKKHSLVQNSHHQSLIGNLAQQQQRQRHREKTRHHNQHKQKQKTQYEMKSIIIAPNQINSIPSMSIQRTNLKGTLRNLQNSRKKYPQIQGKLFLANLRQLSTNNSNVV